VASATGEIERILLFRLRAAAAKEASSWGCVGAQSPGTETLERRLLEQQQDTDSPQSQLVSSYSGKQYQSRQIFGQGSEAESQGRHEQSFREVMEEQRSRHKHELQLKISAAGC
jgi:hypothetical protein